MSSSRTDPACYFSGGHDANNRTDGFAGAYKQCPGTKGGQGMCCRLNDSKPDQCGQHGLCYSGNMYWRESCTDPTWKSPACIKLCLDPEIQVDYTDEMIDGRSSDVPVRICEDGSYCCGNSDRSIQCCNNNEGYVLRNGEYVKSQSSNSSTPDTTWSSGALAPTSDSSSSSAHRTSSNDTGAIVGGVIGGVAALTLGIVCMWFLLRRRNAYVEKKTLPEYYYAIGDPASELSSDTRPVEISSKPDPRELSA